MKPATLEASLRNEPIQTVPQLRHRSTHPHPLTAPDQRTAKTSSCCARISVRFPTSFVADPRASKPSDPAFLAPNSPFDCVETGPGSRIPPIPPKLENERHGSAMRRANKTHTIRTDALGRM